MTTIALEISKSPKGWSTHSAVTYEAGSVANTYAGYRTLATALWETIGHLMTLPGNPRMTSITVKGKPMSNRDAYQIIYSDLRNGCLDYSLPAYRKFLLR